MIVYLFFLREQSVVRMVNKKSLFQRLNFGNLIDIQTTFVSISTAAKFIY